MKPLAISAAGSRDRDIVFLRRASCSINYLVGTVFGSDTGIISALGMAARHAHITAICNTVTSLLAGPI